MKASSKSEILFYSFYNQLTYPCFVSFVLLLVNVPGSNVVKISRESPTSSTGYQPSFLFSFLFV